MSSITRDSVRRERFGEVADDPRARHVRRLLLAQDGSTTRLCEAVAGAPVDLHVLHQAATREVPAVVREHLPGQDFIERITFLAAHGEVLMDNLAYIALEGLEPSVERDLRAGTMPIGHLLARMWVRREPVNNAEALCDRLWQAVGLPDASVTRSYRITTPQGPRMLIAETYRRGMLMDRG